MKKLLIGILACVGTTFAVQAQKQEEAPAKDNKYLEFNYNKMAIKERTVVPYPSLREADVIYAKRIERVIDVREKKNLSMKWPKNPFSKILRENVTTGEADSYGKLKAYKNDSLASVYTVKEIKSRGGEELTVPYAPDPINNPDYLIDSTVVNELDWNTITRYKIIEEWIFDKQRSTFFPRIVAIAPLFKNVIQGIDLGEQALFYVSYTDLRKIIANEELFNRQNDAMRLSYLDFFELRLFSSYITRESNDFDMAIKDFPEFKDSPLDALYESERIKEQLFNWEHDLWEH
jgi:gliding motility associated protien GldN